MFPTAWPRLRQWLTEDGAALRIYGDLTVPGVPLSAAGDDQGVRPEAVRGPADRNAADADVEASTGGTAGHARLSYVPTILAGLMPHSPESRPSGSGARYLADLALGEAPPESRIASRRLPVSPRNQVAGGAHRRARPGAAAWRASGSLTWQAGAFGRCLVRAWRGGSRCQFSLQAGLSRCTGGCRRRLVLINRAVCGRRHGSAADRDSTVWRWKESTARIGVYEAPGRLRGRGGGSDSG